MATTTLTYALLGMLLASGLAAAQEGTNATSTTASHEPTFAMKIDPADQRIAPGGSVTFSIAAKSANATTLHLAIARHSGEGYDAALSTDALDVPAGESATATLTISARENASSAYGAMVTGTDASGAIRYVVAKVSMAKPEPKPEPKPAPRPAPTDDPTFALGATPDFSGIHPGGEARFTIHAKSRVAQTLTLGVGASAPSGYAASLTNGSMDVAPDAYGESVLVVTALDGATTRFAAFEVYAVGPSGERHATHVKTELLRDWGAGNQSGNATTAPRPVTRPEPTRDRAGSSTASPPSETSPAPSSPRVAPDRPATPPNASALLGGIELSIEGFDDAGGLQISLKVGDAGTVHLRVSAESLRAAHDLVQNGDAHQKAHGRLWLRLARADDGDLSAGSTGPAVSA